MAMKPSLSQTLAGQRWVRQFKARDQDAAAELLDAMLLLNGEQVMSAQRSGLDELAAERHGMRGVPRRRVALYAEREMVEATAFVSEPMLDRTGTPRMRATGPKRLAPISPRRGSARVGSEGLAAFVIGQVVKRWPRIFINHPGPEIIRRQHPGTIVIVTDFVGSGTRVAGMLDKFWRVPSVRSWWSLGWIKFAVVAAAGTAEGMEALGEHRVAPTLKVRHIAPTVDTAEPALRVRWRTLIMSGQSVSTRGTAAFGFKDNAALIAFSYRIPNNTPAIIHAGGGGVRPLFEGPVPKDSEVAFMEPPHEQRVSAAVALTGVETIQKLSLAETEVLLVLRAVRGRWRPGAEVELAERTGLFLPEVEAVKVRAETDGLLDGNGRLTDEGHEALQAGFRKGRRRPDIPTNPNPFYPWALRVPGGPLSKGRLRRRP
jgi:hypothetical protein